VRPFAFTHLVAKLEPGKEMVEPAWWRLLHPMAKSHLAGRSAGNQTADYLDAFKIEMRRPASRSDGGHRQHLREVRTTSDMQVGRDHHTTSI